MLQPLKASGPIAVTVSGIVRLTILAKPLKAPLSIPVTVYPPKLSIMTSSSFFPVYNVASLDTLAQIYVILSLGTDNISPT